jgi:hypothetical protein
MAGNNQKADDLDSDLHSVGSDLMDIFREHEYWDKSKQIVISQEMTLDFDHSFSADGVYVGTQKLSILFDMYAR